METVFSLGKNFNYENEVSMDIELNKTCYSKGETIYGTIILTPKANSKIKELLNPYAVISFQEKQNYEYLDSFYDKNREIIKPTKRNVNEINPLGSIPMNFSKHVNESLFPKLKIPFEVKAPKNAYPSCLFNNDTYVIHFLTCEFDSIKAKKSVIFIIKNSPYFTQGNGLLKIRPTYELVMTKHKFAIFSCGHFVLRVTLEKNICPYNDNLPIIIDLDCNNLNLIKIKAIKIYIYRKIRKNSQKNTKNLIEEKIEEIERKTLPLREGEKIFQIKDGVKLPLSSNDLNPEEVYRLLDKDKREPKYKYNKVKLYPSCNGGLLSCQYYIKVLVETNTLFSTNEEMVIPVDFYSPFNEENEINNENNNKVDNNIKNNNNESINNNIKKQEENKIKEEVKDKDKEELKQKNDENNKEDDNIEEGNLNINQQIFYNDFNAKHKEEDKSNKNNNKEDDDDNFEGFHILPKGD